MMHLRLLASALLLVACGSETGSSIISFSAYAAGPKTAPAERQDDEPFEFDTRSGYHVRLERAELHVGALYLNRSRPVLGAQDTPCVLPGLYAAEVMDGVTIDALVSQPREFGARGHGTADRALTGEVWLTGGRVDAQTDATKVLVFSGDASKGEVLYRFAGKVTISNNRETASTDPATPGANPLCKQRIVTPIPTDIALSEGGTLVVRVSPEVWFDNVDFAQLNGAAANASVLEFLDEIAGQPEQALFQGLRSVRGYDFEWRN